MHPHTIDWLRNVEINADVALAEKRWAVAAKYGEKLSRTQIINLIQLFLFPKPPAALVTAYTSELLKLDPEYPVSGNSESVRVMAGLVMATSFTAGSSNYADAFALGLRAAQLGGIRGQPVVPAIMVEAASYLLREAAAQRPNDFLAEHEAHGAKLLKKFEAISEAEATGDVAKIQKARKDYHTAIPDRALGRRMTQLAEESQLLWLVVSDFSPTLSKPTTELTAAEYSLVIANEALERISLLPAPPAVEALLGRALKHCKPAKKKVSLSELLDATNVDWRRKQVAATENSDCRSLLPLCTALEKMEETGDANVAAQCIPKLCPGVKADLALWPEEAAKQYFSELSFLEALTKC